MTLPKPRLFISDIDGTLVRSDKSLAPATVRAAARLRTTGVEMSLISARPPSGIAWIADALDLPGPFGAFNGGTLFGRDGAVIERHGIASAIARKIVDLFTGASATVWLFADGRWYSSSLHDPHIPREVQSANVEPILVSSFDGLLERVDKIVAVSDVLGLLGALEIRARVFAGSEATIARSQSYYLDVTAPAANKGRGVERIAATMGIAIEDVVVIGDQANDIPMFDRTGSSFAMGQASAEVKAHATWSTLDNDSDGVAAAMERLIAPFQ